MLTAKRAFNFMMDSGEVDNTQLMDVARFSPTARGPGELLTQGGFMNAVGMQNQGNTTGSFLGNRFESSGQASASDGPGDGYRLGQPVVNPSGVGGLEQQSATGQQGMAPARDFGTLERRRQRERESSLNLDNDSPMRRAFAVPDPDSDEVRGRDYRFLTENEKTAIRERLKGSEFENMDLEPIKIHGRTPWYLPSDKGAITLENHIMIGKEGFDPEGDSGDFRTLLEEVIHAGQYQSGMTRAGYLWDAATHGGYTKSTYENEAWDTIDRPPGQKPQQTLNERPIDE